MTSLPLAAPQSFSNAAIVNIPLTRGMEPPGMAPKPDSNDKPRLVALNRPPPLAPDPPPPPGPLI